MTTPARGHAPLSRDAFHLVQLANKKISAAFRRLSYRTEHDHKKLGLPRPLHYMLWRNVEDLSPDQFGIIVETLDGDADGQQIAAIWIAKEQLRKFLALRRTKTGVTPAPSAVRDRLASFYLWCAGHDHVPELKTLAETIGKWQQAVIDAVLTGYSNAKAGPAATRPATAPQNHHAPRTVTVPDQTLRQGHWPRYWGGVRGYSLAANDLGRLRGPVKPPSGRAPLGAPQARP